MIFKPGFESRERVAVTEQVAVSYNSEVQQGWTIVWWMNSQQYTI